MKKLYLYILGEDASHSSDQINCPVPKKINEDEIFFGPCMPNIRASLFKKYLKLNILEGKENCFINDEIYLAGINSIKKGLVRKILWTGQIVELTTFKGAWEKIHLSDKNKEKYQLLITGDDQPLHVEPIQEEKNQLIGYRHRKNGTHRKDWIRDLTTDYNNIKQNFIINPDKNEIRLIDKKKRLNVLNRDISFWMKKIFYVNTLGIVLDDDFLDIIRLAIPDKKDSISNRTPFGKTNKTPLVMRNQGLVLIDEYVDSFVSLVKEIGSKLPTLKIN